jgi:hypothetical protein
MFDGYEKWPDEVSTKVSLFGEPWKVGLTREPQVKGNIGQVELPTWKGEFW